MARVPASLKRMARTSLRAPVVAGAARRIAAIRGHGLVLAYHRVSPQAIGGPQLVPTVTTDRFVGQMEILGELGRIVTLGELLQGRMSTRPRFALTFDDDYLSHVEWVLPVLRRLSIPGGFFLSGRTLHQAGPYWFESLEELIVARGLQRVGVLLGMADADAEAMALACERDPHLQQIVTSESNDRSAHLRTGDIEALVRAGMTIGFHTLDHRVLTDLEDAALERALVHGRDRLEAVVGSPLDLFAYPHGRADQRVARRVREAGYVAAWTGHPTPMRRGENPHLLGRWEPGGLGHDEFVAGVSIRLNRRGDRA